MSISSSLFNGIIKMIKVNDTVAQLSEKCKELTMQTQSLDRRLIPSGNTV